MATVIILLPLLLLMELIESTGVIGGSNRKYGGRKQPIKYLRYLIGERIQHYSVEK